MPFDERLEVEEYGPAARVPDEVRGEPAVEALDRAFVPQQALQDAEAAGWTGGCAAVDYCIR